MQSRVSGALLRRERKKAVFLLTALVVHNLTYPMSRGAGVQPLLFYLLFGSMFVIAVFLLSERTLERTWVAVAGLLVFITGVVNAYASSRGILLGLYLSVIAYHLVMINVLGRLIFAAKRVLVNVILIAVSLYLTLGSMFTALYGLLEWLQPGSFTASSGAEITWQQLLYFSYITLASVGYGDITPVRFYAQSFAAFEGLIGVVFAAVLFSRLVGLQEPSES